MIQRITGTLIAAWPHADLENTIQDSTRRDHQNAVVTISDGRVAEHAAEEPGDERAGSGRKTMAVHEAHVGSRRQ